MNTPDLDRLIDLAASADADLSQGVRSEPLLCAQEPRFGGSPGPTLRRLFMPLALPTSESDALYHFLLGGAWWMLKPRAVPAERAEGGRGVR